MNLSEILSKVKKSTIVTGVIIIAILILVGGSVGTIESGHKGVVKTFSNVTSIKNAGVYVKMPFIQSVEEINCRTQKVSFTRMSAASRDQQAVYMGVVVNYKLDSNAILKLYNNIGVDYENKIIKPLMLDLVKKHTAKFNIVKILQNREKINNNITKDITTELIKSYLVVERVNLTNIDFNVDFKQAIEDSQIAQKEVEKQKFMLDKQALEAQQKVKQAEADKQSRILSAEADKETKKLQADGLKSYNDTVNSSITNQVLEYMKVKNQEQSIQKWSGVYPTTVMGGDSVPLIQMPIK